MLFVSRYIGTDKYGVVDTDDGVEDIVSPTEIGQAVNFLFIKIAGVNPSLGITRPYQSLGTKTVFQTKLLALHGVDTTVWSDMITSIRFDQHLETRSAELKLSDLGTSIGDFVLRGNTVSGELKLTLVFDDKLVSVEEYAFSPLTTKATSLSGLGVVFDLRGVKREALAKSVYRSLMLGGGKKKKYIDAKVLDSIKDDAMRKIRMYHELKEELLLLRGK